MSLRIFEFFFSDLSSVSVEKPLSQTHIPWDGIMAVICCWKTEIALSSSRFYEEAMLNLEEAEPTGTKSYGCTPFAFQ